MAILPQEPPHSSRQYQHYLDTRTAGDTSSPSRWLSVGNSRAAGFDRDGADIANLSDQPFLNIGNYGATISDFWWEFNQLQTDGFDFSQEKFILNTDIANDAYFNTGTASEVGQAALGLVRAEHAAAPDAVILWLEAEYDPGRHGDDSSGGDSQRMDDMNHAVRYQANHTGEFIFVSLPTVDMNEGSAYSDDGAHYTEYMYQHVIWPRIVQALEDAGYASPFSSPSALQAIHADFAASEPLQHQALAAHDLGWHALAL